MVWMKLEYAKFAKNRRIKSSARSQAKQLSFMGKAFIKPKAWFGGSLLKGNAKSKRPLDTKFPIHLVLKSRMAVGVHSMRSRANIKVVNEAVKRICSKYGISLFQYANAGNHLHLLIRVKNRQRWAPFIRELTGEIARRVCETHAHRGLRKGFWDSRPFTRIAVGWTRAYSVVRDYVAINQLEAVGVLSKVDRGKFVRLIV